MADLTVSVNRRALLVSGACSAALGGLPVAIQARDFSLQDFIGLSAALTHKHVAEFNYAAAVEIYNVLLQRGLAPSLAALSVNLEGDEKLSGEIIKAWYTGICQTAEGPLVVVYSESLVWRVAPFLHVPSDCGGHTNYWSAPPAN